VQSISTSVNFDQLSGFSPKKRHILRTETKREKPNVVVADPMMVCRTVPKIFMQNRFSAQAPVNSLQPKDSLPSTAFPAPMLPEPVNRASDYASGWKKRPQTKVFGNRANTSFST
jgi:hypothetical protein